MQKQTYKKTLSILIATLLVLSFLPVVGVQAAVISITAPSPGDDVHVGDAVWVNGTADVGTLVKAYWDSIIDANKLGEGYAIGGKFNIKVTIPEDVNGSHWIIADSKSVRVDLLPKIKLTPSSGIPGDTITVDGTGFAGEKSIVAVAMRNTTWPIKYWSMNLTTTPSSITTSAKGSFSCTFKVPSVAYGKYTVNATDASGNKAEATFTVGPSITVTPTEGGSGAVVNISGRGFNVGADKAVTIKMNVTTTVVTVKQVADIKTKADGTFSGQFVVPSLTKQVKYTVNATAVNLFGTATFKVTGETKITLTPTSGAPEESVTIEGINFTAIADTTVTIDFGSLTGYATLKTNSTGGFKGTIVVPSLTPSATPYTVKAKDAKDLSATAGFRVAMVTLAFSPTKGATGVKVLVIGGGFTPSKAFNVTIDGKLMAVNGTGTLDGTGTIPASHTVYLPTISTGVKKLTVMDSEGVSKSDDFEVTKTTELILTPESAPTKYNITIEANYFVAINNTDITIKLYNSTYSTTLAPTAYPKFVSTKTNSTGSFKGWFLVPTDLSLGNYKINATDAKGLKVLEKPFIVVTETVEITTSKAEYLRGEDITFKIKSTFATAGSIKIKDPTAFEVSIATGAYQKIDTLYYAYTSTTLRSDAPLGTWIWNATIGTKKVSGTFKVSEVPTLETLNTRIAKLEESLTKLSTVVDKLSTTVEKQATDIGTLSTAIGDLKTALNTLKTDLANVASTAQAAQSAAQSASTAASDAKTAATDAKTAATDAKTAAAGAASTAAGISTAVYGAMALSAVAAIAAIVAVITLQRKVAG